MAYTEHRNGYHRGRYKNPPGVRPQYGTVSADQDDAPFTRQRDAQLAAEDKEAEVRKQVAEWRQLVTAGHPEPAADGVTFDEWLLLLHGLRRRANGGRDPNAGAVAFADWVEGTWLPAQNLEESSLRTYRNRLKHAIYPYFGDRPFVSIVDPAEINAWERQLQPHYSAGTATRIRTLLTSILADAVEAGLLETNPATRRRRRGRVAERRMAESRERKNWATPLQVLLIAERIAALTGRDTDLVMWVLCAWCGLRWGELRGVQASALRPDRLAVEVELADVSGGLRCKPPKDASFRNDDPKFFGTLDLPPFLLQLLDWLMESQPLSDCRCPVRRCGGRRYLWLGPHGGHPRASSMLRTWAAACTGWHPARKNAPGSPVPSRPVLVDLTAGWPGTPLTPAPPSALECASWSPADGRPRYDLPEPLPLEVECPTCDARPGARCRSRNRRPAHIHERRIAEATAKGRVHHRVLGSWLPIVAGLTPHGFRHSLRVWMDEDSVPEVLKRDRLGHAMPGIGGTYAHVSPHMRAELVAALQARWESALSARLALSPTSPVPFLERLLQQHRETFSSSGQEGHLPIVSQSHLPNPVPGR